LLIVLVGTAHAADPIDLGADPQLAGEIGGRNVVFYATDVSTGERFAYRPEAADVRHAPWSTFKIPNLLIALETGAARSLDHERVWDQKRRPAESHWSNDWKQNQTLETAFRRSAAWYFQDIAKDVGSARYREALTAFGYGNVDVPDASDSFWLGGPLAISPQEQVAFLERLVLGQLNVQQSTIDAIRSVSLLSDTGGYVLRGKTGSGPVVPGEFDGAFEGWLVGWVEKPDAGTVAFALYVSGPSFESIGGFRYQMSAQFLRAIGALPPQ
jgi:beta-lactamase class D